MLYVLVADDDPLNRSMLADFIGLVGRGRVKAVLAPNCAEAVGHIEGDIVFSGLLTDLHMDSTGHGGNVARAFRTKYPETPAKLVTGEPNDEKIPGILAECRIELAAKPFQPSLEKFVERFLVEVENYASRA